MHKNSEMISIRIPKSYKNYLNKKSQKLNLSKSKIIKKLIYKNIHNSHSEIKLNQFQMNQIHKSLNEISTKISNIYSNTYRIGGNLNQIAKNLYKTNPVVAIRQCSIYKNKFKHYEKILFQFDDTIIKLTNSIIMKNMRNKFKEEMKNNDTKANRFK